MPTHRDVRRSLPSVEAVLQHPALEGALKRVPRTLLVEAIRLEIAAARQASRRNGGEIPDSGRLAERAATRAERESRPSLRRVLNATGVVLHTNLGRAPLARPAAEALADIARGYSSLEFDLESGRRGDRGVGPERWLTRLTGAESAVVVNNGAGAILLALSALAAGGAVIVSRGELVEIGGSFRIPEILERSGARLVEVGTTNRTHLRDYERALAKSPGAVILRVHPSNFRVSGFTARPELGALVTLARRRKAIVVEDLGSGALVDLAAFGLEREPTVRESLDAGVDVVTCSGDKLLGGAQAGLVLGRSKPLGRIRKDPLARALRCDKLALAALEATLALYADPARAAREVPVLALLTADAATLERRARDLAARLAARLPGGSTRVVAAEGEAGGGSLPGTRLPGWAVELEIPGKSAQEIERLARAGDPPVIGTIRASRFRLHVRTLADDELDALVSVFETALRA